MNLGEQILSLSEKLGIPRRGTPIDKRMEVLRDILSSIQNVEGLNNHPGWISIIGPYKAEMRATEERLHVLNRDPIKNAREIVWLEALRTAQKGILDIFSRNLVHYGTIEAEYVKLQKDAEELRQEGN